MKKIIISLLIFIPFITNACEYKLFKDYYAEVNNDLGAKTYSDGLKESNFKIPYGEKVQVFYENCKINDEYYIGVLYKEEEYLVKSKDLINIDSYQDDGIEAKDEGYYTVKDTKVRYGPSSLYAFIGEIKANTKVKTKYMFDSIGGWVYITDGEVSGFVYNGGCEKEWSLEVHTIGKKNNNTFYYIGNSNNNFNFLQKIEPLYESNYSYQTTYYVKTKNDYTWLIDSELVSKYEYIMTINKLDKNSDSLELYDTNEKQLDYSKYLYEKNSYQVLYHNGELDYSYEIYILKINDSYYKLIINSGDESDISFKKGLLNTNDEEKVEEKKEESKKEEKNDNTLTYIVIIIISSALIITTISLIKNKNIK